MSESRTVTTRQGARPHFADVRVGVMRLGEGDGVRKAQLMVRSPRRNEVVVVDRGGTCDLHGAGTLRVDEIAPEPNSVSGIVQLTFTPAP